MNYETGGVLFLVLGSGRPTVERRGSRGEGREARVERREARVERREARVERRGPDGYEFRPSTLDLRPSTLDYPSLKAKFCSCGPACHWMRAFRPRLFDKATSLPARVQDASAIVSNSTALM